MQIDETALGFRYHLLGDHEHVMRLEIQAATSDGCAEHVRKIGSSFDLADAAERMNNE
jgi:hypothetical protein